MKYTGLLFCLIILFSKTYAQSTDSLLNHQAPKIVFQDCIDKQLKPDFYKGKILVLDFWATWCGPCIAGFPHFNTLSQKFGSNNVIFAAITNEHTATARTFFKRTQKELNALKLIDTTKTTENSLGITAIPHCVVVDRNNIVKWEGETSDLTEDILDKIVKDQPIPTIPSVYQKEQAKPLNRPIAERALFSFIVAQSDTTKTPINKGTQSSSTNNGITEFKASNMSVGLLLENLTGYSYPSRIVTNDDKKLQQLVDIEYNFGYDFNLYNGYSNTIFKNEPIKNFTISLLGNCLTFDTKMIIIQKKHYELVIADPEKLHSFMSVQSGAVSNSSIGGDTATLVIVNYNLKYICKIVESHANTIFTTNIDDSDHYDLILNTTNITELKKSLLFHGLKLVEDNSDIDMLSINFH